MDIRFNVGKSRGEEKAVDKFGAQQAYVALADAVMELGYPEEFAQVLAGELRSEGAMLRMAAYIRQAMPATPEQIADEMLTIVEQRDRWVQQKMSEHANATMTAFYNRPREDADEDDSDDEIAW